jgi:LPS-assembly protein
MSDDVNDPAMPQAAESAVEIFPLFENRDSSSVREPSAPVDLQASSMVHDDQNQSITASGDVMIVQAGRILRADEVAYDLAQDTVNATGNVVLNEETGNIHLSDTVTYNDRLRNGSLKNLRSFLSDGSRFRAESGERKNGAVTIMRDAFYTPCAPCKTDPDKPPVWGLLASKVTHDEGNQRISYQHARLEAFGVPIAYAPYFSHPDGTVKQKSGFMAPAGGFKSSLGAFVNNSYYWAIGPDQDATTGVMVMTDENPLFSGEYRKRWDSASLLLGGGITSSSRTDRSGGKTIAVDDETRGHVLAQGRWDINDTWRSGFDVNWASDDQYMRQYDFVEDDVLESQLYAERFSGRNYLSARLISFQDTRIRENPVDQPDILPEIVASFKGEPGAFPVLKGQWSAEASALGLTRMGSDQDVQRVGLGLGWERRLVSDYGFLTKIDADMRGDFYHTADKNVPIGNSNNNYASRFFPQLHMQTSYPLARQFDSAQAKIEPVVALTIAPNISSRNKIPNEDSNDVQIDASNLFEPNRFPGLDRVEDHSRVTYGLRGGLFGNSGSSVEIFMGQSYRLTEDDNPFPAGSGLDGQSSDIVGQFTAQVLEDYYTDYRFQIASEDISSQRHELDAWADWDRLRLSGRYLYASGLAGTDLVESREQVQGDISFYAREDWRLRTGAIQDLGQSPGLRKAYMGIDYLGQCLYLSLTGEKNYTSDASGDSDTEILFRVGLKNLAGFEESRFQKVQSDE